MDIRGGEMEKIDLTNIKSLATEICSKYFFQEQNCEQRAEEAILEASNYENDDPVKYFTTMAILTLKFYGKKKNVFYTFLLNDNASMFSLDVITRFTEFPFEGYLNQVIYHMCNNLSKDPRRCIDSLGYLSFWHDIHMNTLTYRHRGAPIDDEFVYILYFLLRNITFQTIFSGDIKIPEKAEEVVNAYIKEVLKELKEINKDDKK